MSDSCAILNWREALDLERETMVGCGEFHPAEANYNGERSAKCCLDQHMVMVSTHHSRGGLNYWNAREGREIESRLDYIVLQATRLQLVKHCFGLRRKAAVFSSFLIDALVTTGRS